MGAERRSQYLDPEAKLATAYHEVCQTLLSSTFLPNFYAGWACPCRPLYRWSNAFTQGHMHAPWSYSGIRESHCLTSSVPDPILFSLQDSPPSRRWSRFNKFQAVPRWNRCIYGWSCRRGIEQVFLCPFTGVSHSYWSPCYQFTEAKMSQVGRVPISEVRLRRQKPWWR